MRTYNTRAYAKLNLSLDIKGLREDGYHELESVMQTVSVWDDLELTVGKGSGITLECNLSYIPTDDRNLAVRAAQLFYQELGRPAPDLHIKIDKKIPVGAGMAGGSADAAGVLRLLNQAEGRPFTGAQLQAVGLRLGADVPFCLVGGTCLCGGVGEQLTPLPPMPDCAILIAKPAASISTKTAYGLFDEFEPKSRADIPAMERALAAGDLKALAAALGNSLEAPIMAHKPIIAAVRDKLRSAGALGAMMTGSGSAVFGIFPDQRAARRAVNCCRRLAPTVMVVRPQAKYPD